MAKQKALWMLPRLAQRADRGRPRPHQVAHCLVCQNRNPDGGQFAGPMQLRQHRCIAAIRLYPVTRLDRDQRWRNHHVLMPGTSQKSLLTVAKGPPFVAKAEPPIILAEPSDHSAQNLPSVLKYTDPSHLAATAALCHGHAYRRLVHPSPTNVILSIWSALHV